jgi:hypothetical protein
MVKQAQLNRSETAPIFGYDYAYEVPDDCLRILSVSADGIHDEQYGVDWRRVGAYIYTNVETLYACISGTIPMLDHMILGLSRP